jgi:hypothetical protein
LYLGKPPHFFTGTGRPGAKSNDTLIAVLPHACLVTI